MYQVLVNYGTKGYYMLKSYIVQIAFSTELTRLV